MTDTPDILDRAADLQAIYAKIPRVKGCKPSCSACCGPVPMIPSEAAKVAHIARPQPFTRGNLITPTNSCGTCTYSTKAGCSIYETRPFMCRLFATSVEADRLRCPYGAKPDKPLTAAEAASLTAEYVRTAAHLAREQAAGDVK